MAQISIPVQILPLTSKEQCDQKGNLSLRRGPRWFRLRLLMIGPGLILLWLLHLRTAWRAPVGVHMKNDCETWKRELYGG